MRYWKAAAYGGLAGLPWAFLMGLFIWVWHFTGRYGALLFAFTLLTGVILGVPLAAVGGVLLVKFKDRIPSNSTFVKAAIMGLAAWALSLGAGNIFRDWFFAFGDFCSLAGVLLWASGISYFVDSDRVT